MTKQEELRYLISLTLSASEWRLSEGDERDPLRMEIEQRIEVLLGAKPEVIDGREQSIGTPTAKSDNTVRVSFPDHSSHRVSVNDVHKEPFARSPSGYRWVINEDKLPYYLSKYSIK